METILNIFANSAFSATSLTAAINMVPNDYGRLRELDLFENEPISTTTVAVQFANGTLNLLPTRERSAPASLATPEKRSAKAFRCFHIPHDDFIMAEDIQNILSRTADDGAMEAVGTVVNRRLITMRRKHAITLEHMRMGALRGEILDYDGSSLLNLFTEYGVTQKVIDFTLGTGTTEVGSGKVADLVSYMEDNLLGETMTGVHVLCSPEFFRKLIAHPKVIETYKAYDGPFNPLRTDLRRAFPYMGVVFEEYRGSASQLQEDGTYNTRRFIPAGDAIAFPLGTQDTFRTFWAPANFLSTVNTLGEQLYTREYTDPEDRWVKLHSQSNPLPMVKRPALLVRLTTSN